MAGFFNNVLGKLFGNKHDKDVKSMTPQVDEINAEFEKLATISNDQLRNKTQEFRGIIKERLSQIVADIEGAKEQIEKDSSLSLEDREQIYKDVDKLKTKKDEELEVILNELLPQAFAVVKEVARRFTKENDFISATATELDKDLSVERPHIEIAGSSVKYYTKWDAAGVEVDWQMVHYDVQLIGGIVLHDGKIAEMRTGEGKTLVSTLPAYLNGLSGQGVHMVTVNDYLARRDSEWMEPIYNFLGLTVDCIDKHQPNSDERRAAYRADITYGTNNDFGFDYLRDNMVRNPEELVQRKHHYAMVDEVDSVLVDDARTPLIISGQVDQDDSKQFYDLKPRIQRLVSAQQKVVTKFLTDAKKEIAAGNEGTEEGQGGLALLRAFRGLPKNKAIIKYLSESGVKQVLQKVENHYMQNNSEKMPVADEELYFTIDEKNNSVELTDRGVDLITDSGEDKQFFIIPDVGAEIAEIEKLTIEDDEKIAQKDKLMQDFAIKAERLHSVNQLLKAYSLFEKEIEYIVVDGKVKIVDENTGRVMDGRRYSDGLHQAIEAKENVKVEKASQTLATITLQNYFRMYHKLAGMTGTAETEAKEFWDIYELDVVVVPTNRPILRDDREDLIYRTRREKFNAVIDEILNLQEQGRPILVGTTNVEISELLSRMLTRKKIKHNVLNAKQHSREADIVAEAGKAGQITIATNMAGRGTDIKLSPQIIKAGGLAIIGSERHDSRRIDRQLRGRAGRQGDPGSSQFYVSLEDNLMRLFGSERIAKVMDRLGYEEGEVIQHSMITKSLERAQRKVEENNFGTRKRLLEYDDVMNNQRNAIYDKRRHALFGDRLVADIMNAMYDVCEDVVAVNQDARDYEGFKLEVIRFFSVDTAIDENSFTTQKIENLAASLYDEVLAAYERKTQALIKGTFPILQKIYGERGETVKNVGIPLSDGTRGMQILVNLEKAMETEGKEVVTAFQKAVVLANLDESWKEHLRGMDDLKQEVQTASYEQKDPLLIYKLEAFEMFKKMLAKLNKEMVAFLFKGNLPVRDADEVKEAQQTRTKMDNMKAGRDTSNALLNQGGPQGGAPDERQPAAKAQPVRVADKVGRNDPCPCGSGKKYKKCHGVAQ